MSKLFWQKLLEQAGQFGIGEPVLPQKRKAPKRFEVGSGKGVSPSSPESHFKVIYLEALDTVVSCIKSRFDQKGFHMYHKLEQILVGNDEQNKLCHEICTFYSTDLDKDQLITQLHLFHANYPVQQNANVHDVIKRFQEMPITEREQLIKLVSLILVILATNAVSERSFSAM